MPRNIRRRKSGSRDAYRQAAIWGPEHVLHHLARYTHRVAISNHRIVNVAHGKVTFRWKDYAHKGKQRIMALTAHEFLRRFLLHVLPRRFVRIRFFGFLANRRRKHLLPLCQHLLNTPLRPSTASSTAAAPKLQQTCLCSRCGAPMVVIEKLTAKQLAQIQCQPLTREHFLDSS